jgi:hypothetical protein
MRRTQVFFLIIFFIFSGLIVFAQGISDDEEDDSAPEWLEITTAPYSQGDKNFVISLGAVFPLIFTGVEDNQHGLSIGGTGALALNYFLTSHIFVGGEISAMFCATRGGNMLYIIPYGARIGYHFWYKRFEFPISLMLGGATEKYLEKSYLGFFVKPSASAFWRFNQDWSFGLNAAWWFIPQMPKNGNNVNGNFLELSLAARYHF